LAWTLAISPNVVPIPGTKQRKWLRQNVASIEVTLTPEVLAELDTLPKSVAPRY
jgi:aryl-alcohol dehydrogenase-like predicted oxidoreductase